MPTPGGSTQNINNQQTQENQSTEILFNNDIFSLTATQRGRASLSSLNDNPSDLIEFSMGLNNLISVGPGFGSSNVGDINLSGELSGYWISDPSLKQVAMVMTVFQSFPVKVAGEDKPYTMVVDQTSTIDGAGTNKGELCIGTLGCPDGYNLSLLDKVASNTKGGGFKVGASFWNERGLEYLNHYYPEVGFTLSHVNKMRRACILNAEVAIPTSGTSAKAFKIKVVDEGPRPPYAYAKSGSNAGLWKLDIIGAFCMLSENAGLFELHGKKGGKMVSIDNTVLEFPFKDGKYNILTGEISGYTPEAMKEFVANGLVNPNKSMITKYFGHTAGGEVACRVKFYVDPAHRSIAEEIVGKSLPDEFFTTNGNYAGQIAGGINMIPGDGSIGSMLRQAAILVSNYCISNKISYDAIGGYIKHSDGLVVGNGTTIDCASGINCMLATAGIFTYKPGELYGNTAWWRNGGHLSKLAPGYSATKIFEGDAIDPSILEPGDIVVYDKGKDSYNHVSMYISPTEHCDFGTDKKVASQQPLQKPIRTTRYNPEIKKLIVWRITSQTASV